MQAAYDFRMVIRLDRNYLPKVEIQSESSIHQDRGISFVSSQ